MIALNLLTANIHMGFSFSRRRFVLPELREAIREVSADVVFLQEVQGAHSGHARRHARWPDVPHYEFLADSLWPQFAYGQNAAYPHGHHGNALLSKFPIVQQRNLDVSVDGHEGRGLLHCVLEIPGSAVRLHTLCVHLGLREAQRRWQVDRLLAFVADAIPRDAPLVIAGDFNDWRERAHRQVLAGSSLAEVHASAGTRPARTFPAWWPRLRLDRIYVRNLHHRPLEMPRRPWSQLSDHAPLAGEIRLGTTGAPGPRSGR